MNVGILTYHFANNYGAVLQAYALQKQIEKMGLRCQIINYRPAETYQIGNALTAFDNTESDKTDLPHNTNLLKSLERSAKQFFTKVGLKKAKIDSRLLQYQIFKRFSETYLKLGSKTYRTQDSMRELNDQYDVFITGSDQVWNPRLFSMPFGEHESYFLDFVEEKRKKNAYSASFGISSYPQSSFRQLKYLLSQFNHISVREESGIKIIQDAAGITVKQTLDPVFLMDRTEWDDFSPRKDYPPYVLVYTFGHSPKLHEYANYLAKKFNLKILQINVSECKCKGARKIQPAPEEFPGLFRDAQFVLVNSFHGCVFSIIFNKPFYIQYEDNAYTAETQTRFQSLLSLFHIDAGYVSCDRDIRHNDIDWSSVNQILETEKEKSKKFLTEILDIRSN